MNILESLVDEAKKKKKQLSNNVRDVFDANTASDQQKRIAAGQPRMYQAQQAAKKAAPKPVAKPVNRDNQPGFQITNNSLTRGLSRTYDTANPLDDGRSWTTRTPKKTQSIVQQTRNNPLVDSVVTPVKKSFNTVAAGTAGVLSLPKVAKESVFGTDASYQKSLNDATESIDKRLRRGAYLTPEQSKSSGDGLKGLKENFIKPTVKATSEVAPLVIPASGLVRGGKLATRVAVDTGANATVAGTSNAAQQLVDTGKIDRGQLIQSTAIGGVTGGGAPIVGAAVRKSAPAIKQAAKVNIDTIKDLSVGNPRPFPHISDEEAAAAARVQKLNEGWGEDIANVQPNDAAVYRQVQAKLGAPVNDTRAVSDMLGALQTYNTRKMTLQGGFVGKNPFRDASDPDLVKKVQDLEKLAIVAKKQEQNINREMRLTKDGNNEQNMVRDLATRDAVKLPPTNMQPVRVTARNEIRPTQELPPEGPINTPDVAQVPTKGGPTRTNFEDESKLNVNRLNTDEQSKNFLNDETTEVIGRLSNKDVMDAAKRAGIDTKSHTIDETKLIIAKQLNVRQDAVKYLEQAKNATDPREKAALLKQAAERGRTSREQGSDVARQLQARKIIANELDTPEQRIFKLLDEAGVNPDVYSKRLATVDFNNPKDVVRAYREMVPAKSREWLDLVRYNSMLSSPLTQAVNIFGNAQNVAVIAPVEKTLRGAIDAVGGLFGKERQYAAREGAAYLGGAATNINNAGRNFVDALRGRGEYANADLSDYIPIASGGVKGGVYNTLSVPMRVLDGMDKFFRTLSEAGEDSALNARQKAGIKIKGNRAAIKKSEADYRVFQTELGEPGQGVINDAFDEFAKLVMRGRNAKNPLVSLTSKFTVPFVKTVNNIGKQGIVDYSPLGFVNTIGNADKTTAITRAIMGSAIFGTSAALIAQGQMTWAEPRDAEERARFRAEGKQPYSIKIGGKWVNFSKLTPAVAFPMAMTAALHDSTENKEIGQSQVDSILESMSKFGNFLADQSYAKSVGDTLGAIGGDKEAIASAVSNNVQQVVPFRALTGWIARISDDTERKVDTSKGYFDQQVQSLMQQYPGLRQQTATRDYKGQPIAANNPVLNGISPVKITDDRGTDPLDAETDRLAKAEAQEPDFKLNKQQLAEFTKFVQPEITASQKELINSPEYKQLSTEDQQKQLTKLKTDITAARKADYMAERGLGQYASDYTGDRKELSKDQKKILSGEKSAIDLTTSKNINKKISSNSKKVLADYDKLDDDEREQRSIAEPDFDYNYAVAKYENDKANGTLTRVQDIKAKKEIDKLLAGKDFDRDTRDLYGLGKSDVYELISSDSDGNNIAAQLLAYGDALEAAGIADNKFRDKYGNVDFEVGSKSGGGGGKKGGKAKTLSPSLFKTPYDNIVGSQTKGAALARDAKLARKS